MMDGSSAFFDASDIFTHRSMLADDAQAGILYVEDFDAAPDFPAPSILDEAPEILPPTYSLEDYNAACQAAHEAGLQAGLIAARQEQAAIQAQLRHAALAGIADALGMGGNERAAAAQQMGEALANILLAMLLAALPAASATLAGGEVTALLAVVLPPLRREPSLHIQVNPALLADIEADLAPFAAAHAGTLTITASEALAPADVLVRWADGEMRRDTEALWAELRQVLAPFALPTIISPKGAQHGQ